MTIESTQTKQFFEGNGVATVFPVLFQYSKADTIDLIFTDRDGKGVPVTENFQIEVAPSGTTNVLFPAQGTPIPAGTRLTVHRNTPLTQIVDLIYGGAFNPDTLEHDALDRIVMMIQELHEALERAIKVSIDSDKTPEELLEELLRASDAAERAEDAARRAEEAAKLSELASLVKNARRSWTAQKAVASGGVLTLPTGYYPGRQMMLLFHEGTVCNPVDKLSVGSPQYEEVGDPALDAMSYEVRVNFPIAVGEELSVWVIASNAYRVSEEVAAAVEETHENVLLAQEARTGAETAKDGAQTAVAEIRNLSASATTLAPGSAATANYNAGTGMLSLGIPRGDKGDKGESVTIKTVTALPSAGGEGDLYVLEGNSHLYGWNAQTSSWNDLGAFTVSNTVTWEEVTGKPSAFTPSAHASAHSTGGADAITPAGIGALPATGTAVAAAKLAAARFFSLTGAVTGSASSDLSGNVTISTALGTGSTWARPQTAAGVGQWTEGYGVGVVDLPSGGTWAYDLRLRTSGDTFAGVAAGGTAVGPTGTDVIQGLIWRIA